MCTIKFFAMLLKKAEKAKGITKVIIITLRNVWQLEASLM
jgi:hypothetical protein